MFSKNKMLRRPFGQHKTATKHNVKLENCTITQNITVTRKTFVTVLLFHFSTHLKTKGIFGCAVDLHRSQSYNALSKPIHLTTFFKVGISRYIIVLAKLQNQLGLNPKMGAISGIRWKVCDVCVLLESNTNSLWIGILKSGILNSGLLVILTVL